MRSTTQMTRIVLPLALIGSSAVQAKDVTVSPAQVERLEIKLEGVRIAETEAIALLPGTVTPAMNARLMAASPFAGTLVQLHVLPGQHVTRGAPIATISSRELLEAMSQLAQSEAELQMAEAIARRKRTLADKNFQVPAVAEEAEAQVAKIKAVIEQHRRTASLGGMTIGQGGQYTITAPADGTIVEARAMLDDKLDAMAPVVSIDTSAELSIEVQVPAYLVARIKPGDKIQVINGPEGTVISVGGSLDRMTRSATLIASVPANSGLLPGQMVTLTVQRAAEVGGLAVPSNSVARINGRDSVFVRTDAGFKLVAVTLRGRSPFGATVEGNLAPDAKVAASGLPQLEQMLAGE